MYITVLKVQIFKIWLFISANSVYHFTGERGGGIYELSILQKPLIILKSTNEIKSPYEIHENLKYLLNN